MLFERTWIQAFKSFVSVLTYIATIGLFFFSLLLSDKGTESNVMDNELSSHTIVCKFDSWWMLYTCPSKTRVKLIPQNFTSDWYMEACLAWWLSSLEMETATRVQILDETICVSIRANCLWKRRESISSFSCYEFMVLQTGFFCPGKTTTLKRKLWIQTHSTSLTKPTLCQILIVVCKYIKILYQILESKKDKRHLAV